MFGFGKKTKPAKTSRTRKAAPKRKATGAKKTTAARKAAKPRTTRAACVVCRERAQTNTTLRICGRRRCATELRARSQQTPAPAKAAPRRAPATRRPAAPDRVWPAPAMPAPVAKDKPATDPKEMTATELATWWQEALARGQRAQIKDWNHHHRQWRNEVASNAAALNQVATRLTGPDQAALNDIATAAAAITDDHISRTAEADTHAKRPSSTAARLLALGDRLTALTLKYERAGVIKVNRS